MQVVVSFKVLFASVTKTLKVKLIKPKTEFSEQVKKSCPPHRQS